MAVRPQRSPPRRPSPRSVGPGGWSVAGTVVVVGLIISIAGGGAWLTAHVPKLDPETLCPKSGPSAVTVILIDATDGLSRVQRAAVNVRLGRVLGDLRLHEQIAVFRISSDGDPLQPVLTLCRPTRPEEQNQLTGSAKQAQKTFETKFKQRIEAVLQGSLAQGGSDRSPIMEAIQGAAVASFQPVESSSARKRLVVVSDMLENGAGGSHYRGVPDFEAFEKTSEFAKTRSDLSGVEATVLYLRRDDGTSTQGRRHADFWASWFAAQGASLESVVPIEG